MSIFKVSRNTVDNWFNSWESSQLSGLYNQPGRGRKRIFNFPEGEQIKNGVKESPKNLEKVPEKIKKEWQKTVSKKTIKRVIKF